MHRPLKSRIVQQNQLSSRGHAAPLLLQGVSGWASDGDESRDRGLCVIPESLIICKTFLWTAVLSRDYRCDQQVPVGPRQRSLPHTLHSLSARCRETSLSINTGFEISIRTQSSCIMKPAKHFLPRCLN